MYVIRYKEQNYSNKTKRKLEAHKKCSNTLVIKETQIKTTASHHCTSNTMAKI